MSVFAGLWLPGATLGAPALLLAGLAASPHCALMCGPLAALNTIGARSADAAMQRRNQMLTYTGRLLGYASFGTVAGACGQWLLHLLPTPAAGAALQAVAAAATTGTGAWILLRRSRPTGCCPPRRRSAWPPLLRGLLWAALPCGILYAVLLLSALSGSAASGALLAGAFALGSTPALSLSGWLGARRPASSVAARVSGLWLITLGLATLVLLSARAASLPWCAPG